MSAVLVLGDVADVIAGVGFPKDMQGGQDGAIPVFKVGDISTAWLQGKSLLHESRNYLSAEDAKSLGKCVPAGATVFAKIGEALRLNRRVMLGRPALVDNNVMGLVQTRPKSRQSTFTTSCRPWTWASFRAPQLSRQFVNLT